MKRIFTALLLILVAGAAQAAPEFEGPGCKEDGTGCVFGTLSGRVSNWSKKGTVEELGERCEKFIRNIEDRKNEIAKTRDVVLAYKNFTYYWSRDTDKNGFPKIVCSVQLHSELPTVKFTYKTKKRLFWVCDSRDERFLCKNYYDQCEAALEKALKDKDVLDATIWEDASLLQGRICETVTIGFKTVEKKK